MGAILSTKYEDRDVGMIMSLEPKLSNIWKNYPMSLLEEEKVACGLPLLIPMIESKDKDARLPSKLAGLKANELQSDLLKKIDKAYSLAMEGYKTLLTRATVKDGNTILKYRENYRIEEEYCWLHRLIFFWGLPFIGKERFARATQPQRLAWIHEVLVLECQRLVKIEEDIIAEIPNLTKQLKALSSDDSLRPKLEGEIEQLEKVFKAVTKRDLRLPLAPQQSSQ